MKAKSILLLLVISSLTISCTSVQDGDRSVNLVPVEYDGVVSRLDNGKFSAHSQVKGKYNILTAYAFNYDGDIAFDVGIQNIASTGSIRIYDSDIEVFSGSVKDGGWVSLGKWSYKEYLDHMDKRADEIYTWSPIWERDKFSAYTNTVLSADNQFRSNDIDSGDSYIGRIFYPFRYSDYAIVITLPDGLSVTHYYRMERV